MTVDENIVTDTNVSEHKSTTVIVDTSLQCFDNEVGVEGIPIKKECKHQNNLEYDKKGNVVI